MGDTNIQWTDKTWNPTRGCSRVSAGCGTGTAGGCYAERQAIRHSGPGRPYEGLVRLGKHGPQWTGEVRLVPEMMDHPFRWKKPQRVFVNSMSDLFHEKLTNEEIAAVFGVMAACPQHTFQILTKRPEWMKQWFDWFPSHYHGPRKEPAWATAELQRRLAASEETSWPLPNAWLGVSVEDQATADERIPLLLDTSAAVRFVSYEPALGPIEFNPAVLGWQHALAATFTNPLVNWIIVGGESGPGSRPFDLAWARSTVRQCREAGIACYVKQLGARPICNPEPTGNFRTDEDTGKRRFEMKADQVILRDRKGGDMQEWPEDLRVRQFPDDSRRWR